MIISAYEIFDIVLMAAVLGFIFKDRVKPPRGRHYDPLKATMQKFDWEAFWFAVAVTAPAVILHEFGHKFVAMAFGAQAVLHAPYTWLAIAGFLKLVGSPVLFFVAGYVSIISPVTLGQNAMISVAGPAVNILLFAISYFLLKYKRFSPKVTKGLVITRRVNLILAVFNMLPIPGFDGWHFYSAIIKLIF